MKIGFFGAGLMGQPMIKRLQMANMPLVVYNRTASILTNLQAIGIEVTTSAPVAIANSDVLILMLTDNAAIEEVLFSGTSSLNNRTVIQMGTITPSESKILAAKIEQQGGEYLEAPVLGSIPEAKAGTLLVMVGATESQFQRWLSILQHFGTEPRLIGAVGTAAAVKLALNQLIASLTTAFALSLAFLKYQDVDIENFMDILRQSALYAPTFDKKLARINERNFANPNFPTKHLLKDVDLFLQQAEKLDLNLSSLKGVREVIQIAMNLGVANADYSALSIAIDS